VGIPGRTNVGIIGENGNLLASGQTGEIAVQGPAVSAGYAKNPTANREAFINGWFRTGDEGRLDGDGYLYVTGRIKEIINRGGQKISPREIDEVLSAHPAVAEAVAFPVPDSRLGEDIAAAVVLRAKDSITEHALRTFIADQVADYKVPRQIYFIDQIPTGPTGKLQRVNLATQLGVVGGNSPESPSRAPYLAPSTETQKALVEIWTSVLGVEHIGIHDHFLALGGDSLLLAQLTLPMQKAGWPNITVLTFFERPTIAGLAELIDSETEAASRRIDVRTPESDGSESALTGVSEECWAGVSGRGDVAVTHWPIQPRGTRPPLYVMGSFNEFTALGRRLGLDQPVLGVPVPNELKLRIPYRVEDMAAAQVESILKGQSSGPCNLAGFSAEGVLAYEVAQQLTAKGREVRLVILVDTSCPAEPDPLLIRMIRNAGIHVSNVSGGGMEQLRLATEGIMSRLILRMRIHSWRLAHQLGIPVARPAPRAPMDVLLANAIATRKYVPRAYTGRVLLFKRTRDLIGRYRKPDNGWGRVVRGGLEVYRIEGDHFSLLAEPGVQALAQKLAEAMEIQCDEPMLQRPAIGASRS
jgi:thioesterase domain-containing protein